MGFPLLREFLNYLIFSVLCGVYKFCKLHAMLHNTERAATCNAERIYTRYRYTWHPFSAMAVDTILSYYKINFYQQ